MELIGRVLSAIDCKPVQGAVLDVWQADANGNYDNKSYNLRGKIVTDKAGKYVLDTIYPGRLHTGEYNSSPWSDSCYGRNSGLAHTYYSDIF